jgi:hypothetical protein
MYTDESMYHHVPTNTAWKCTFTSIYINLHGSGIARSDVLIQAWDRLQHLPPGLSSAWIVAGRRNRPLLVCHVCHVCSGGSHLTVNLKHPGWSRMKQNTWYILVRYTSYTMIYNTKVEHASGVAVGAPKSAGECSLSGAQVLLRSYLACLPGLPPDDEGSWLAGNWLDAKFQVHEVDVPLPLPKWEVSKIPCLADLKH